MKILSIRKPCHESCEAAVNGLRIVETVTDGNCGVDAFIASALSAMQALKLKQARREPWAQLKAALVSSDKSKAFLLARRLAAQWLNDNLKLELWENFTHADLANAVSGDQMAAYLRKIKSNGHWADTCFLHALGCACDADVLMFQADAEPTIVGPSLIGKNADFVVPVALQNEFHFWAMCQEGQPDLEFVDKGDGIRPSLVKSEPVRAMAASAPEGESDPIAFNPLVEIHEAQIKAEIGFCEVLSKWNPFDEPSPELIAAMQTTATGTHNRPEGVTQLVLRRQAAISQLAEEAASYQEMDKHRRYQRAERIMRAGICRCTTESRRTAGWLQTTMAQCAAMSQARAEHDLQKQCWSKQKPHTCISQFANAPAAVRNWRILWFSLPPGRRQTLLLEAFKHSSNLKFLGLPVCQRAFQILACVGGWSLTKARDSAANGNVSCWSQKELGLALNLKNTSKAPRYLDARAWLEEYAEVHAEMSPMSGMLVLPGGRKMLYYLLYLEDRKEENLERLDGQPADYVTFLKAWRYECPWIVAETSLSMFTACGTCDFLKDLLDKCSRSDTRLTDAIRCRLGQHFRFQSAQRLSQDKLQEHCRRSGGKEWFMKIDKMDQKKTIVPCSWSLWKP